ncbi:MAG: hypothetical protein ACLVML_12075 [Candidatus Gastranaerophilaceae bacterium]|jgi:hypothetical protein|nr:hypothetical protein [Christensenellales bacterium]
MKKERYYLYLSADEHRLLIHSLIQFRNKLIAAGRYTNPVDELIVKVSKAKTVKLKVKYI